MLTLRGAPALSPFRRQKLLAVLVAAQPAVKTLHAEYIHLADVTKALSAGEISTLEALLNYGPTADEPVEASVDASTAALHTHRCIVLPRPGTISPWSSKATDIAHNTGLGSIKRLERGVVYRIDSKRVLNADEWQALGTLLHDRMTDIVRALDR